MHVKICMNIFNPPIPSRWRSIRGYGGLIRGLHPKNHNTCLHEGPAGVRDSLFYLPRSLQDSTTYCKLTKQQITFSKEIIVFLLRCLHRLGKLLEIHKLFSLNELITRKI